MLKKFKDWLIKKLGGFTKAEYDDWSRLPVSKLEFIPEPMGDVVTLCADVTFNVAYAPPPDWIEATLCGALANKIKPYVRLETHDDFCRDKKTVRAYVKVVGR